MSPTLMEATQDHLHIRGEYIYYMELVILNLGSPPHTWRIRFDFYGKSTENRITSTYVENTEQRQKRSWRVQDHLHIRGEYHSLS